MMVPGDDLGGRDEEEEQEEEEDSPQLLRTRSDASFMHIQRRTKTHSARDLQRLRTHRFSINGHFYNHKVPRTECAVTWPAVGASSGTVRLSCLTCARRWRSRFARCKAIPAMCIFTQIRLHRVSPEQRFVVVGSKGLPAAGISSPPELPVQSVQGVQEQVLMQQSPKPGVNVPSVKDVRTCFFQVHHACYIMGLLSTVLQERRPVLDHFMLPFFFSYGPAMGSSWDRRARRTINKLASLKWQTKTIHNTSKKQSIHLHF